MSDIRPFTPLTQPSAAPATGPAADVRQAQAAFFRAALERADPVAGAHSVAQSRATITAPAETTGAQETDRPLRPGSYLDIKV